MKKYYFHFPRVSCIKMVKKGYARWTHETPKNSVQTREKLYSTLLELLTVSTRP